MPPTPASVRRGRCILSYLQRLSATDISALASMKNVAKCDTWCELQDPANHRVFERKLRPEPSGRGHVCLGVTHRCPHKTPSSFQKMWCVGAHIGLPHAPSCGWLKFESSAPVVVTTRWLIYHSHLSRPQLRIHEASFTVVIIKTLTDRMSEGRSEKSGPPLDATPGQAGLPAEFKHINKRRKRNLQGFP